MKNSLKSKVMVVLLLFAISGVGAEFQIQKDYLKIGVVGASYESAQSKDWFFISGIWYLSGNYQTWVDMLMKSMPDDVHIINYARAGANIDNAFRQAKALINDTLTNLGTKTSLNWLVVGPAINGLLFGGHDPENRTIHIINKYLDIINHKKLSDTTVVILGWPEYDSIDIEAFAKTFFLPRYISRDDYNAARVRFYDAFSDGGDGFIFVDPSCEIATFEGLHPDFPSIIAQAEHVKTAIENNVTSTVLCAP